MEFLLNVGPEEAEWPMEVAVGIGQSRCTYKSLRGQKACSARRPSLLPWGPGQREVGVCIRVCPVANPAISHAAASFPWGSYYRD